MIQITHHARIIAMSVILPENTGANPQRYTENCSKNTQNRLVCCDRS